MYKRIMKNYAPMNLIYTTEEGNELWLGDYFAATNLKLLKQKKIDSGRYLPKNSLNSRGYAESSLLINSKYKS